MNAQYWVEKALKEAVKDKSNAARILVKYFAQAMAHVEKECEDAAKDLCSDCEKCSQKFAPEPGDAA